MWVRWGVLGACAALSACAAPNNTSWWDDLGSLASSHVSNQFNFDWSLVGDQRVAPLHIFSSERQVWLQYASTQHPPVVTGLASAHREPFPIQQRGSYWVIDTDAKALQFQNGEHQAWAYLKEARHRVEAELRLAAAKINPVSVATPMPVLNEHTPVVLTADSKLSALSSARQEESKAAQHTSPPNTSVAASLAVPNQPVESKLTDGTRYTASLSDKNLRLALQRWANESNWTFETEHWAVDVDLPITANFSVISGFTQAVQSLVASTQLGTHPLKPCFYSNQVLRIIRLQQSCGPTSNVVNGGI